MILKIFFDKEKVNEEQDVPKRTQETELNVGVMLILGTIFGGLSFCVWEAGNWVGGSPRPLPQETRFWSWQICVIPAPGIGSVASGQVTQSLEASGSASLKWAHTTSFFSLVSGQWWGLNRKKHWKQLHRAQVHTGRGSGTQMQACRLEPSRP